MKRQLRNLSQFVAEWEYQNYPGISHDPPGSKPKESKPRTLQQQAHDAVAKAISAKKIPPAKNLNCAECDDSAKDYHHHNGYEKEHWLDVTPLCRSCHWGKHHE